MDIRLEFRKGVLGRNKSWERGGDVVTAGAIMEQIVPAGARALARATRARVRDRGDLAGQGFPGWRGRGFVAISPRYPLRSGGHVGPSGAIFFPGSQAFHEAQGVQAGTYDTSGEGRGMWSGWSTVVESTKRAVNAFRGRSEGQNPNFFRYKARGKRKAFIKARGEMVNNSLKGATVLKMHGVNVVAPSQDEINGLGAGSIGAMAIGISGQLPVEWQGKSFEGLTVSQVFAQALP